MKMATNMSYISASPYNEGPHLTRGIYNKIRTIMSEAGDTRENREGDLPEPRPQPGHGDEPMVRARKWRGSGAEVAGGRFVHALCTLTSHALSWMFSDTEK